MTVLGSHSSGLPATFSPQAGRRGWAYLPTLLLFLSDRLGLFRAALVEAHDDLRKAAGAARGGHLVVRVEELRRRFAARHGHRKARRVGVEHALAVHHLDLDRQVDSAWHAGRAGDEASLS